MKGTIMKTLEQIQNEIDALRRLGATVPYQIDQASIAGQIEALKWATSFEAK